MKEITLEEFEKFEIINGVKQCPNGDYSLISSFGEWCSFGKSCSFGEWCSFGKSCSFENGKKYIGKYPFMAFVGAGSRIGSKVYFFNLEDGIYVRCGCWFSSIKDFEKRVKSENADTLYLDFARIAKKNFKILTK